MKNEDELSIPLTPESQRSNYSSIDRDLDKIPNEEKKDAVKKFSVSFHQLFNYADFWDFILIVFSSLLACLHGLSIPILLKKIGEVVENFLPNTKRDEICNKSEQIAVIGFGVFVVCFLQLAGWKISSQRQIYRIRESLYKRILQRDVSWFNQNTLKVSESFLCQAVYKLGQGIGDNIGLIIYWFISFIVSILISFILDWKLAITLLAASIVVGLFSLLNNMIWKRITRKETDSYTEANEIIEQAIDNIDTVTAFDGSEKEALKYNDKLDQVKKLSIKKNTIYGIIMAIIIFLEFSSYTLGFWYGPKILYDNNNYHLAKIITIIFLMRIVLIVSIERVSSYLIPVNNSKTTASTIYPLLLMKPTFKDGDILSGVRGNVSFEKVFYTKDNEAILNDFSFKVEQGETLVIADISRKTSNQIFELLLGYYLPNNGLISLDGHEISTLNWKFLQRACGYLPKIPELFSVSVEENLRIGNENISTTEITEACHFTGVFDYISSLPLGFDTVIDDDIYLPTFEAKKLALTRLLLRNSKTILIEQPFFNLKKTEIVDIKHIIDNLKQDRTVIIITNELEEFVDYERLIIMSSGEILEEGSINELKENEESLFSRLTSARKEEKGSEEETIQSFESMEMVMDGEENTDSYKPSIFWILKNNSTGLVPIILGIFFSLICGAVFPVFAIIFGKILENLDNKEKRNFYSYILLILSAIAFIGFSFKGYFLSKFGVNLVMKIRISYLKYLLNQDLSYFSNPNDKLEDFVNFLSKGVEDIENLVKNRIGTSFQAFAAFITGFIIACVYSWQIGLLGLGFYIVSCFILCFESKLISSMFEDDSESSKEAKLLLNETFKNIRTITQLGKEDWMVRRFQDIFDKKYSRYIVKCIVLSILRSLVFSLIFFALATSFILSVKLIRDDKIDYVDVFRSIMAVLSGILLSIYFQALDRLNYSKSMQNVEKYYEMTIKKSMRLGQQKQGLRPGSIHGILSFQDVWFSHPSKSDVPILQGVNFRIKKGESLALVGDVGKTACLDLLERFFDPSRGLISLDDNPIERLNIKWLRNQIGLVDGKGFIFDGTIADAIAYGDNSRLVDMDEVINAAKKANVHDFIATLPHGYLSKIGKRGYKLSLSNLQKICIARALLRRPRILLLNNATSSLDIENEIIVHAALEEGQRNRTTIIVSDRLSSIHNADRIAVIKQGQIVEIGDHSTLIDKSGIYYSMYVAETKSLN